MTNGWFSDMIMSMSMYLCLCFHLCVGGPLHICSCRCYQSIVIHTTTRC